MNNKYNNHSDTNRKLIACVGPIPESITTRVLGPAHSETYGVKGTTEKTVKSYARKLCKYH